jgi:histidine triad (HIT) family protein
MASDCIFCKIINKEIPAKIVFENADILAFEDIKPQAPVHIVVVPKTHIEMLSDVKEINADSIGKMVIAANSAALKKGIGTRGYRVVVNCGQDAGQAVPHLHMHVLGGRTLGWPPG